MTIPGPTGPQPIVTEIKLEVGRPAGIARGSTLSAVFAVNVASLPLSPGGARGDVHPVIAFSGLSGVKAVLITPLSPLNAEVR